MKSNNPYISATITEALERLPGPDGRPTDILFTAAGAVHSFENFSGDLTLSVMFYGPEGGASNGG